MFLATTGLTEFWDTRDELVLLGSWCLRPDRRHVWQGLRYQILPNPWDNRTRFDESFSYLEGCGERLLASLGDYLNAVHQVSMSPRYWRILIGPWLFHYLHILYDRWVHLRQAFERYPGVRTILLDEQSYRVPQDTLEAITWTHDDRYNLQLFTQLLAPMRRGDVSQRCADDTSQHSAASRGSFGLPGMLREALNRICLRAGHIAVCDCYFPRRAQIALAWRRGVRMLSSQPQAPRSIPEAIMDTRRQEMARRPWTDSFEHDAVRCLPYNFPRLFLEGFDQMRRHAVGCARRIPPVVVSGNGWYYNEAFKWVAAEAQERGSRLICVQHGGGYGLNQSLLFERHERTIGDAFISWGWSDPQDRVNPMPSLYLGTFRRLRRRTRARRRLLLVTTEYPRYLYRFDSAPAGSQWEAYHEAQRRFLGALPERLRAAMVFRPFPIDYGRQIRQQIARRFPTIGLDCERSLRQHLQAARLVVVDHPGTTMLEVLAADIPLMLFWEPQWWPMRPQAAGDLELLRQASILSTSPEEAAAKVAAVADDPQTWWHGQAVRAAREQFARRYAWTQQDWLDGWSGLLVDTLRQYRQRPALSAAGALEVGSP